MTDIEQLTPKMLAALPEDARQAVAEAYANAFIPLFMASCAIALIGLCAALMLKPTQLPRAAEVRPAATCRSGGVNADGGPQGRHLQDTKRERYTFKRSNGVPRAIRCAAERLKANPRNLIRLTPAEGLDA